MIYTQALLASLLAITFPLPLNAQYLLRAHPPLPTTPPLFIRQLNICRPTETACADGSGCCDIGAACIYSKGLPLCQQPCGFGYPLCSGVMNGLCCYPGYTCDYVSTGCVQNTPVFPVAPTFTPIVIPTIPIAPTLSLPLVPSWISEPTFPSPTTPSKPPISTTSSNGETSSSVLEETPSTPTTVTPSQFVILSGQGKLGLDLKLLSASYGLAFFSLGTLDWII